MIIVLRGGGGNPEGKKVSVPIRDTSDYSVTGGGGEGGGKE